MNYSIEGEPLPVVCEPPEILQLKDKNSLSRSISTD